MIEWEITYRINSQGFRDVRDYPHEGKIAFVGDSYTAALGSASNWVAELGVYNLGIGGAGIEMMEDMIRSIEWPVRDIYIVLISGDFLRTPWTPSEKNGRFEFCGKGEKRACFEASVGELRLSPSVDMVVNTEHTENKSILKSMKVLVLVKRSIDRLLNRPWTPKEPFADEEAIARNRVALQRLTKDERVKGIIQLPQREEVSIGRYLVDGSVKGLDYYPALYRCSWTREMYYANDPHPNEYGYQNIRDCIKHYLRVDTKGGTSHTMSDRDE
jgi:hypothetical protein